MHLDAETLTHEEIPTQCGMATQEWTATQYDQASEPGQRTPSIESSRIPIPYYTSYNTISPSYTPLPGVMTAWPLRTSLILMVEFHAVCRCTICGAQVDSEARIPGITMTVRVDIFTKPVTRNPQINQPKCIPAFIVCPVHTRHPRVSCGSKPQTGLSCPQNRPHVTSVDFMTARYRDCRWRTGAR